MTYGLSKTGFKSKKFHEIKNEIENSLLKEVDPNLRFTPDTIAGVLTGIMANQCAQVWEELQALYSSLDPSAASGKSLDSLCSLTGTFRKKAKPSEVKALVRLTPHTSLPKGSLAHVEGMPDSRFVTLREIKNSSPEEKLLEAELKADNPGKIYAPATKLNQMATPQAGWLGITNPQEALLGRLDETDEDLRLRRFTELRASGSSTYDGLRSHLLSLDGVRDVYLSEGEHEFSAYVLGGDEEQIAKTIWRYKPLGVHTSGLIDKLITAPNKQKHIIKFNRPEIIKPELKIKLKTKILLSEEELLELKAKIIDFGQNNFVMGEMPYPSRIYPILFAHSKVLDVLQISLTPVLKSIQPHQIVSIESDRILIELECETK